MEEEEQKHKGKKEGGVTEQLRIHLHGQHFHDVEVGLAERGRDLVERGRKAGGCSVLGGELLHAAMQEQVPTGHLRRVLPPSHVFIDSLMHIPRRVRREAKLRYRKGASAPHATS